MEAIIHNMDTPEIEEFRRNIRIEMDNKYTEITAKYQPNQKGRFKLP